MSSIIRFGNLVGRVYVEPFSEMEFQELLSLHPALLAWHNNIQTTVQSDFCVLNNHVVDELQELLKSVEGAKVQDE